VIVRLLLWNLADSKTSLEELRARRPALEEPSTWLVNEASERFGLVAYGDEPPDVEVVRELIGRDPDVAEEFESEPGQYL
jgi:hypothetical protein